MRAVQNNLRQCALLIGDERGMIGRTMPGWQEYNASLSPFANAAQSGGSRSWGGRPVVNLLGDDLQLPPVLDAPCYDRTRRGPAANHGLPTRDGIKDAVVLTKIARQGEGDERIRGVLTRLRTYGLTDGDAGWIMDLQIDKLRPKRRDRVTENCLYLFSTHNEDWAWNKERLRVLHNQGVAQSRQ